MANESISVVIPAYNSERTICGCLKAIKQQSLSPIEVIVVDDSSTDQTVEIAKEKAVVIPNIHRKGAGGSRNTGAYATKGDIIVFTDSDCIPSPDWLQKICNAFKEEGVGAVAGGYSSYEGRSFIGKFAFLELVRRRRKFPDYVETAVSNNFAVRSELFKEVGGFPELFTGATLEDMVFSFRVSRIAKIRWLRDNGVGHYFTETARRYLHQQYEFGRDTVVTYKKFPELIGIRTHQGYLIYFETFIAGLTLLGLIRSWLWFGFGIFLLWVLNFPLLCDNFRAGGFNAAFQAFFFIPLRDFNWVRSTIGGLLKIVFGDLQTKG